MVLGGFAAEPRDAAQLRSNTENNMGAKGPITSRIMFLIAAIALDWLKRPF